MTADHLSDAELHRRLTQRGISPDHAEHLVRTRDHHGTDIDIYRILNNERTTQ